MYKAVLGVAPNLDMPQTFNEKIQWIKLNYRLPVMTVMADKIKAKEYVRDILGSQYIVSLLAVWDDASEIDFSLLPERFVIKCNHNSGLGMCICRDRERLNEQKARKNIAEGLKEDFYSHNREWCYRDINRMAFAEQFIEDGTGNGELTDYKFYCFDGEPQYLYISHGLENHATATISFLNIDWTFADFGRTDYAPYKSLPQKPKRYLEMLEIARVLAKGFPFIRVDLFETNGKIFFSEFTFYPCAGMMPFKPVSADEELGKLLHLPFDEVEKA